MGPPSDFEAILTELARAQVGFIVVGGVGGVLHGAPLSTFDLDVVHARGAVNRRRLARVLRTLEAEYFRPPGGAAPSAHELATPLHHILMTRYGRLDLLGTIHAGLDYEDLLHRSVVMRLDSGVEIRVLDLRA